MPTDTPDDDSIQPQFLEERGITDPVSLPSQMLGVYSHTRKPEIPVTEREYQRRCILTSEGWVPPAPRLLARYVESWADGDINELRVLSTYTVTSMARTTIDPVDLRRQLQGTDGNIVPDENFNTVLRSPMARHREKIDYYVPAGVSTEQTARYIQPCVFPALGFHLDRADDDTADRDDIVDVLVERYGVSADAAYRAVELEKQARRG